MNTPQKCGYRFCDNMPAARAGAIFCSRQHKSAEKAAARRATAKAEAGPRRGKCENCGQEFVQPAEKGRGRRFCPEHDRGQPVPCRLCGKMLREATKDGSCRACRPKPVKVVPVWTLLCACCGRLFEGRKDAAFCSQECRRKIRHQIRAEAAVGDRFRDEEIYERDGWMCQLCGDPIDRAGYAPEPLSRSIDHRTPVSKGGKHTRENCQAAHLRCNNQKASK